ncbi:MAG: DNA-3-methyladenine glycosylase I [Gammaproteobacteria bacterium]|nr:DNA-3-methyladenine glycosylase I [Gammaproteobacteria bacterium]
MTKKKSQRCPWCESSDLYRTYHDEEWGRPCFDARKLFEMLNLEGAQAGLSWITILNKRENYRRLFADFDPVRIKRFSDAKLEKLLLDPGIVRHKGKIAAVRGNAIAYLEMEKHGESFSDYIWSYVGGKPVQNHYETMSQVPGKTAVSDSLSKDLKKRGFKFVGSTIAYAFMQAAGLVNDHLTHCPQHSVCAKAKLTRSKK